MFNVPEKLINFEVYDSARQALYGVADVELPEIAFLSDTMSGAGIMGEIDAPTLCQLGAMSLTINWRMTTEQTIGLLAPVEHALGLYGAQQVSNPGIGGIVPQQIRVEVRARPKTVSLGSLTPGGPMDGSTEFEVVALSLFIGNAPLLIIDKLAYVFQVATGGVLVDYSAALRVALGRV